MPTRPTTYDTQYIYVRTVGSGANFSHASVSFPTEAENRRARGKLTYDKKYGHGICSRTRRTRGLLVLSWDSALPFLLPSFPLHPSHNCVLWSPLHIVRASGKCWGFCSAHLRQIVFHPHQLIQYDTQIPCMQNVLPHLEHIYLCYEGAKARDMTWVTFVASAMGKIVLVLKINQLASYRLIKMGKMSFEHVRLFGEGSFGKCYFWGDMQ